MNSKPQTFDDIVADPWWSKFRSLWGSNPPAAREIERLRLLWEKRQAQRQAR